MARIRNKVIRLDTKTGRDALRRDFPEGAREPFWQKVSTGRHLGLRLNKAGESWIARYRDEAGVQHYNALGELTADRGFDQAKVAAETWFKDLDVGVTGKTDEGQVATVKTACERYVKDRRRNASESNAHDADKRFMRTVYSHSIAALPLSKFRAHHLKAWRDGLIEATETRKALSKGSADRTMAPLKAALSLAFTDGLATGNLMAELDKVPPYGGDGKRRDLYLDKDQRAALLDACEGPVRDLVEAALLTGCRAGELTSATRGAYDARTQTLRVTGKTGPRQVPLAPRAKALFDRLAKGKLPGAFLLTKDGGGAWRHSDWDELIREAAAKAKLPAGVCLYTLRHSFITAACLSGMPTLEVARIVGTSLQMIEKHYGHVVVTDARARLAKVDIV
jgi:integrase